MRLKRNCTRQSDYIAQTEIIKQRSLERDYNRSLVDSAMSLVLEKEDPNVRRQ